MTKEQRLIADFRQGMGHRRLQAKYGLGYRAVMRILKALPDYAAIAASHVPQVQKRQISEEVWAAVIADARNGVTIKALHRKYGVPYNRTKQRLREAFGDGLRPRLTRERGTPMGVMYATGCPLSEIALLFGYASVGAMYDYLRHLPEYIDACERREEATAEVLRLHADGLTSGEIADILNRPRQSINTILRARGLRPNRPKPRRSHR